ncbi:hypothetical protein [Rosenbergiella nectarea]|uniref:hypothetical protein n=1 Tax=Rosenbergiella nectarea TaxID=988801 RepID=UPI001F4DF4C6|nr:hypothetical protein [Rosenbergiella nectarea]
MPCCPTLFLTFFTARSVMQFALRLYRLAWERENYKKGSDPATRQFLNETVPMMKGLMGIIE